MNDNDDSVTLELMIDRLGMRAVLALLAAIASEKAEHVRSAWQDEHTASDWDRAASAIDKASSKVSV